MSELKVKNKVVVPSEMFGNLTVISGDRGLFFIGKEVAEMLGYKNTRDAISKHCKKKEALKRDTLGGSQSMTVIPESDVYRLIIKSKLPAAEQFEEWVMEDVLPQIRKNGSYTNQPQFEIPSSFSQALALASQLQEDKETLLLEVKVKDAKIEEDVPKIEIYEGLIDTEELFSISTAANNLNIGLKRLYVFLRNNKVLKSHGEQRNLPYQRYMDSGYFLVKSKPYHNSITGKSGVNVKCYVTGRGMAWLEKNLPL